MKNISVLGIDLAKRSFQLHGLDSKGRTILKKSMSPRKADQFKRLVIVAAPGMLGELRSHLDEVTGKLVVGEFDKEMTGREPEAIASLIDEQA